MSKNLFDYLRPVLSYPGDREHRENLAAAMIACDIDALSFGDEVWILRGNDVSRMPLTWNPHRVEVDVEFTEFIKSGFSRRLGLATPEETPSSRAVKEAAFWNALVDILGDEDGFDLDDTISITDKEVEI
jgi:hypothetical protein